MKRILFNFLAIKFLLTASINISAQIIENTPDENNGRNENNRQISKSFLGIKLQPEVQLIVKEIERRTGNKIYADFVRQEGFILASSYISEEGTAYVLVDYKLENGDAKKLEAVIAHELLHLRLTANGYPAFIFSDSVNTAKGRAIDTEQDNINDLRSLIEHQIFKAEMEKFGLYKHVDLAGDTAAVARRNKGKQDGQTESINYVRAILEYQNAADIEEVRKIYAANKWTRALSDGKAIANIISASNPKTAKDSETVFLKCLAVLYPFPNSQYYFKLTPDPEIKSFKRMTVSVSRRAATRRRGTKRN
jgi:hypothetical protein